MTESTANEDEGDGTISFPIEFVVYDTPLSSQASAASKDTWKAKVAASCRAVLPAFYMFEDKPLAAQIIYFAPAPMQGDIDNIVKPILDALIGVAYADDKSLEFLSSQKVEPGAILEFASPTPTLLDAIDAEPPAVYVRVLDDLSWRVVQ